MRNGKRPLIQLADGDRQWQASADQHLRLSVARHAPRRIVSEHAESHFGTGLLLTLGTAVAGSFIYGHGSRQRRLDVSTDAAISATAPVTLEMIAMWKATGRVGRLHRSESADLTLAMLTCDWAA